MSVQVFESDCPVSVQFSSEKRSCLQKQFFTETGLESLRNRRKSLAEALGI